MDFDRFTRDFNQFMLIQFEETRKQKLREKVAKSRFLKKAKNPEQYNLHNSNIKAISMGKLRQNDEEKVRKDQARTKKQNQFQDRELLMRKKLEKIRPEEKQIQFQDRELMMRKKLEKIRPEEKQNQFQDRELLMRKKLEKIRQEEKQNQFQDRELLMRKK